MVIKLLGTRRRNEKGKENKAGNAGTQAMFLIFWGTEKTKIENYLAGEPREILSGITEHGLPLGGPHFNLKAQLCSPFNIIVCLSLERSLGNYCI